MIGLSTINRARISAVNYVRTATITANNGDVNFPASNVALDSPYNDFYQSSASIDASIYVDFGTEVPVDDVALDGLTMTQSDILRIRLSSTGAGQGGGDLFDSGNVGGVVPGYDLYSASLASTVGARYLRVDVHAASQAASNFFRIGRIWAGPSLVPTIGLSYPYSEDPSDPSQMVQAPYAGKKYFNKYPRARVCSFSWGSLNRDDAISMKEISRIAGQSSAVLFVPDPTSDHLQSEAVMGYFTKKDPISHPQFPIWGFGGDVTQSI